MQRRSPIQPSKPSQADQFLHPILQATLESLDVQLDEELVRYRRLRGRRHGKVERDRRSADYESTIAGMDDMTVPPPRSNPVTAWQSTDSSEPPVLGQGMPQQRSPLAIANWATPDSTKTLTEPSASHLTQRRPETSVQSFVDPDNGVPEDYLASSEELLRSIAEEDELRAEQEPGMLESLLTPLGIGSLLLLLLSSVTFGYLIMNPASLNSFNIFNLDALLSPQSEDSASNTSDNTSPTSPPGAGLPSNPLDREEFRELSPDSLPILPVDEARVVPSPPTSPSGVVPASPTSPAIANEVPSPPVPPTQAPASTSQRRATLESTPRAHRSASNSSRPAASPPARRTEAAPRPVPSIAPIRPAPASPPPSPVAVSSPMPSPAVATAPASTTPAAQSDRYYVVTDYNSDRSLDQARQAVGDAYVRNFPLGARVQMGVFSDEGRAEELVQDLQEQGIPAQVYQP